MQIVEKTIYLFNGEQFNSIEKVQEYINDKIMDILDPSLNAAMLSPKQKLQFADSFLQSYRLKELAELILADTSNN